MQLRPAPSGPGPEGADGTDAALAELESRLGPYFDRVEPRQQAIGYARALLARSRRRNGWQIAEQIGDSSPWRTQRLLNRAHWDVHGVRDVVREHVVSRLGDPAATVAVGELAVRKKGSASAGVYAQYDESTRRVENCQIGLFAAYLGRGGGRLVDRELYLPPVWTEDPRLRRVGGIPPERGHAGKPELARSMLERLAAARVPFSWVAGGVAYGRNAAFRGWLAAHRYRYVLGIPGSEFVDTAAAGPVRADAAAERAQPGRDEAWAWLPVQPPGRAGRPAEGDFRHVLLVHRPAAGQRAYYLVHAPATVPPGQLPGAVEAGAGFADCLRAAREDAGLDQYEVRSWKAWYRHVTLSMLASAALPAG